MNVYVITYRKPDGTAAERHISAANHNTAVKAFLEQGLGEPIRVERAEDDYGNAAQLGNPGKSATIAVLVGVAVAVGVVVAIWWRRGCPKFW